MEQGEARGARLEQRHIRDQLCKETIVPPILFKLPSEYEAKSLVPSNAWVVKLVDDLVTGQYHLFLKEILWS